MSISNINSTTASLLVETQNLELFSASALISISNLNASSASQQISIDNLNTNSASVNTSITNINSATASLFTSASLALVTASFDTGTRNLTFTKGNTTQFSVNIPDVSGSTSGFATLGANTFTGSQTISSSLFISGNINMTNGSDLVTHHVKAAGSNGLELQTSAGTIIVAMGAGGGTQAGFVGALSANSFSSSTINGLGDPLAFSTSVDSRLDSLEGVSGSFATTASFNAYTSSTNIRLNNIETTTASLNTSVSNLNTFSASALISISNLNQSSASQQISIDSINAKTGSFATTGSNSFVGNQTITGSLILSSSNAVELQVIGNSVFTGSAFGNVVALSITSNTASMDLSLGNYFTLTLAGTATTHISASNVQPGTSATLVITTGTNSSASLAPTMLQPSGSAYSATNGSGKKDVLSIVSVSTGVPFVVSTLNMI